MNAALRDPAARRHEHALRLEEALAAGHASFRLKGEKLHGGWSLRRIEGRRWLLVKRRDDQADGSDPVLERPESVVSGRTIKELGE